jgi:tryptophan synthase alpha chain
MQANSLAKIFEKLSGENRCALMPYFMSFYPNSDTFKSLLLASQDAGADVIEVGVPFSDPIADGPAIQEAGQVALAQRATPGKVLELLGELRGRLTVPLVIMTYANPILAYGTRRFFEDACKVGVRGAVIPDLSLEDSAVFGKAASNSGVDLIQFVAPTTPVERLGKIAKRARGFTYLVSVTGVTGARPGEDFRLGEYVRQVREAIALPVCVGFGIATPSQAAAVAGFADGVIMGSALVGIVREYGAADAAGATGAFLKGIREAIDIARGASCGS